jgi:histidinol-phosphatase (PHP family)
METLGFSDHCPLADGRWSSVRMANDQLDEYIAAVHDATVTYPNLKVLLGLECEYLPELKAWYVDDLYGGRKFDYLVGGAHYFPDGNGWTDTYGGTTDRQSLLAYADYVVQMIESGLFAFIAHPTFSATATPLGMHTRKSAAIVF